MNKLTCKVCGTEFVPTKLNHYVALCDSFSLIPEKYYDAFDCPQCGSQIITQRRKLGFAEAQEESEVNQDGEE